MIIEKLQVLLKSMNSQELFSVPTEAKQKIWSHKIEVAQNFDTGVNESTPLLNIRQLLFFLAFLVDLLKSLFSNFDYLKINIFYLQHQTFTEASVAKEFSTDSY
jgi:hypothetical protein